MHEMEYRFVNSCADDHTGERLHESVTFQNLKHKILSRVTEVYNHPEAFKMLSMLWVRWNLIIQKDVSQDCFSLKGAVKILALDTWRHDFFLTIQCIVTN